MNKEDETLTPQQAETLAKIDQKLDDLVVNNTADHEQIRLTQGDIYDKLDTGKTEMYQALNNRPRWSVMMWLIGGVFAAIMIVGTMVYHVEDMIENHIDAGQAAWMRDHPGEEPVDLRGDD